MTDSNEALMKLKKRLLFKQQRQHLRAAAEQLRFNITGKIPIIPNYNETIWNGMSIDQQCICWKNYYDSLEEECSSYDEFDRITTNANNNAVDKEKEHDSKSTWYLLNLCCTKFSNAVKNR